MRCFFQIIKCQGTGEPIRPFAGTGLKDRRVASALPLPSFQMQLPYISRVCHSPQRAAFSEHPWTWSHRTPANSPRARGLSFLPASFVPAQHPRHSCSPRDCPQLAKKGSPPCRHTRLTKSRQKREKLPLSWPFEEAHLIPRLSGYISGQTF